MKTIGDLDHLHLFAQDPATLADAFEGMGGGYRTVWKDDLPVIHQGHLPVIDVVEDVPGGCLVRVGRLLNTAGELAAFVHRHDGARTLADLEIAVDEAERLLVALGGIAAERSGGRWRPIDAGRRAAWSRHLSDENTRRMRADAEWRRRNARAGDVQRRLAA